MLNVLDVARYIIKYSNEMGYGISNLRLQKLLYFVQAYYLAFTESGERCFSDSIEAWDFGPVVPKVYHEFKCYGSGSIPTIPDRLEFDSNDIWSTKRVPFDDSVIPNADKKKINAVVDQFSDFSTTALVNLTHDQRPWKDAYGQCRSKEITPEAIRAYFKS